MATNLKARAVVGYVVPVEDLFRRLLRRRAGIVHKEDRFDPRTGKPSKRVNVVDVEEGWDIVIDDHARFEGPSPDDMSSRWSWSWHPDDELLDVLGDRLGCRVSLANDFCDNYVLVCFQPLGLRCRKDGSVPIDSIAGLAREIKRIGRAAKELRLKLGRAGVYSVMDVS